MPNKSRGQKRPDQGAGRARGRFQRTSNRGAASGHAVIAHLKGEGREKPGAKKAASKAVMFDRILDTSVGQNLGYKIAKSRTLRALTGKAAKVKKD